MLTKPSPDFWARGCYYEEVISSEGFSRAYSIAYHLKPPTRVLRIEDAGRRQLEAASDIPLRHVHVKTKEMQRTGDPIRGRVPMFFNADCLIARCRPAVQQTEYYRNAQQDEMIFVHSGTGRLESMYGELSFGPMDYLIVPKCTTYRLVFDDVAQADLLVVEARGTWDFRLVTSIRMDSSVWGLHFASVICVVRS